MSHLISFSSSFNFISFGLTTLGILFLLPLFYFLLNKVGSKNNFFKLMFIFVISFMFSFYIFSPKNSYSIYENDGQYMLTSYSFNLIDGTTVNTDTFNKVLLIKSLKSNLNNIIVVETLSYEGNSSILKTFYFEDNSYNLSSYYSTLFSKLSKVLIKNDIPLNSL